MIQVVVEPRQLVVGQQASLAVRLTNTGQGTCRSIVFTVRLPLPILLLRGSARVELGQLAAGETATHTVQVRPKAVGTSTVTTVNFSYRDHNGLSHRGNDVATELTVVAATVTPEEPAAEFTVDLLDTELPYQEWTQTQCRVVNTGWSTLRDTSVSLSGQIEVDADKQLPETLVPGSEADFSCYVRALASGQQVPIRIHTSYTNAKGRRKSDSRTLSVRVTKSSTRADSSADKVQVLYLAANPKDTVRMLWDRELREIRDTIRRGEYRDRVVLTSVVASRVRDMSQALLDTDPRIVHFSGHGAYGNIYMENDRGRTQSVTPQRVGELLSATRNRVECVIVNACETEEMARVLATSVEYAIGMGDKLNDRMAIDFSVGFYQALGANRSIDTAFMIGRAQLDDRDEFGRAPVLFHHGRRVAD